MLKAFRGFGMLLSCGMTSFISLLKDAYGAIPGFTAEGAVSMRGTRIGSSLECDGASLTNRTEDGTGLTLAADHVEIGGVLKQLERIGGDTLYQVAVERRHIVIAALVLNARGDPAALVEILAGGDELAAERRHRRVLLGRVAFWHDDDRRHAVARGGKFDIAGLSAAFRSRSVHADRKPVERSARVAQNRFAVPPRKSGANLVREIEPAVNFVCQPRA